MKKESLSSSSLKLREKRYPINICYVTGELFGWSTTTEANQAIYGLAQLSANLGDKVTLLWAPLQKEREKLGSDYEQWLINELYQTHLIKLIILDRSDHLLPNLDIAEKASAAVHHFLRLNDFDVAYFSLEGGLAYYSLLSKECGLAHLSTDLRVLVTEPLDWRIEADRSFVGSTREVATGYMERYCAQFADQVIYNSSYIKKWMRNNGWNLSADSECLPALQPFNRFSEPRPTDRIGAINELVFVNGFGERFGFQLFCDAIDKLAETGPEIKVTALGYFGELGGEHTGGMLLRRARKWPFAIRMLPWISDQDILQYLSQRNCLLVLSNTSANQPALVQNCLKSNIPFVATDVGGIAELIQPSHRKRCLSKPTPQSLSAKIAAHLKGPQPPIKPRIPPSEQRSRWTEHFAEVAAKLPRDKPVPSPGELPKRGPKSPDSPLVTIVLVHHDRPQYLAQSLASVMRQDYPNIELIVVDDGSKQPESHAYLDEIEREFKKRRGWRILREPNRYLGAARNAGIRSSKGEFVLFLDDDNALFDGAVSAYVTALETSGSDICTAFSKLLYEPYIPANENMGFIQYFPLGGCLDLALIHNSLGDANAMIRKTVFKKIGYLIEDWGFVAQDWEFFARAVLEGLKLRIIPEPLYWYRSNPQSMFRSSSWQQTREPILDLFRRFKFEGTSKAIELLISQNVSDSDKKLQFENLWFELSNERHRKLAQLSANSREAVTLLAEIASTENRPDTALSLLGQEQGNNFIDRVQRTLGLQVPAEDDLAQLSAPFSDWFEIPDTRLRDFVMLSRTSGEREAFYIGDENRLFIEAKGTATTVTALRAGCPTGTLSVAARAELGEEIGQAAEVLVAIVSGDLDAHADLAGLPKDKLNATSGWHKISRPNSEREIKASLEVPTMRECNLVIAIRCNDHTTKSNSLVRINSIVVRKAVGSKALVGPRHGPPSHRQRAYSFGETEFNGAKLATPYRSSLPLVLVDKKGGGLFLRPHKKGPVVAVIGNIFPPFAKRLVGSVEIAHEEAADFEFGMALFRSDAKIDWRQNFESQVMKFSGWFRQESRFTLMQVPLELDQRVKTHLSLALAVRLPHGSKPDPANAYFRKIIVTWNE